MDEFSCIFVVVIIVAVALVVPTGLYGLTLVIHDRYSYTGYITDTSYSQSGSTDITVIYFVNRTIILNSNIEINRYCNATLTWDESFLIDGKRFIKIEYL